MRKAIVAVALFVAQVAYAQRAELAGLVVSVTRNGQPVANATVCVGTSLDRNLFFQGTTDSRGRVRAGNVPGEAFVVTARAGEGGAQRSFNAPATPLAIPIMAASIAVPASGGPSCPTAPAGPQRRLVPPNLQLPPAVPPPPSLQIAGERCFGALGIRCGQPQGVIPVTALCADGHCFINPGSWDHDECCVANPQGMACRAGPIDALTGHDGNCVTSWNKAVRLVSKGIMWKRAVDFSRVNNSGTVEFTLYCAPSNTLLPPGDMAKCCSGQSRSLTLAEGAAAFAANETLVACR